MRVTPNMMNRNVVSYLHRQAEEIVKAQKKIASQKRINTPSDDPIGMSRVLNYRSTLATIDQYQENIAGGKLRLEASDQILEAASDLVNRAKRMAEEHYAPDITAEKRQVVAEQIKDIYDQILDMANFKFDDNHMFSGHCTDTAPFTRDANYNATYNGDDGDLRIVVGENLEVRLDADGRNIFQNAAGGGVNIFDQLRDLIIGLENPDLVAGSAQIEATVDPLSAGRDQVDDKRYEYGAKLYHLEITEKHWTHFKPKIQDAMGVIEEADIPKAIIEMQAMETAYQTTLATAARIIQPSLINFL